MPLFFFLLKIKRHILVGSGSGRNGSGSVTPRAYNYCSAVMENRKYMMISAGQKTPSLEYLKKISIIKKQSTPKIKTKLDSGQS